MSELEESKPNACTRQSQGSRGLASENFVGLFCKLNMHDFRSFFFFLNLKYCEIYNFWVVSRVWPSFYEECILEPTNAELYSVPSLGQHPLPMNILYFDELNMHKFRLFLV